MQAEYLAKHATHPIPVDGIPEHFLGCHNTDTRQRVCADGGGVAIRIQYKRPALHARALLAGTHEVRLMAKFLCRRKSHSVPRRLVREALAAYAAPVGEDFAAPSRFETGTETALASAANFGWTVGWLHDV
jgi:hypothetical protein